MPLYLFGSSNGLGRSWIKCMGKSIIGFSMGVRLIGFLTTLVDIGCNLGISNIMAGGITSLVLSS